TGYRREPLAILRSRLDTDALDVLHHGEAERVGVDAPVTPVVETALGDEIGIVMQHLEHGAVIEPSRAMQAVEDLPVDETGAALVHHLGLLLRVEILGDVADDTQDLPLPGLERRTVVLDEVEDVLLRQPHRPLA